jgi:hypothetical protein
MRRRVKPWQAVKLAVSALTIGIGGLTAVLTAGRGYPVLGAAICFVVILYCCLVPIPIIYEE